MSGAYAGDDFGGEATPYPLFWLKYDDISTYLARHVMMASNYNKRDEHDGGRLFLHESV